MRHLFWLLLVANLGMFAYFNLGFILPSKPQIKALEIDPEKIQLLSQREIEALPKKTVETPVVQPTPVVKSCYEWGIFSDVNLTNAQAVTSRLSLQAIVKEENSKQAKRFWVYRPPLKSAAEAQLKAAELKALGVEDLFVVQEAKFKNSISFGIFEDEQLAIKLLDELKAKGVKNVMKSLRTQGKSHSSLLLNNVEDKDIAELKKLKPDFPEADLKEVNCTP